MCSICLDNLSEIGETYSTECFHIFHFDCIIDWYKKQENCPNFRISIAKPRKQELKNEVKIKAIKSINNCTICIESMDDNTHLHMTECLHLFHKTCLSQWVTSENGR